MNTKPSGSCSDPDFFRSLDPAHTSQEARPRILAAYLEDELAQERKAGVSSHLEKCPACARFLSGLEEPAQAARIASAVCPSSEILDRYLFDRPSVSATEARRIESHLRECPLCREECAWLKDLELPPVFPAARPAEPWFRPLLAAAAVAVLALAAFFFWRPNTQQDNAGKLRALAVIKEPAQIDYAELELTSKPLDSKTSALYSEAVADFKQGRFEEASRKFEQVVKDVPGHSGALFLLGYSYYKMNQPEKAFELCDRAEGVKPHAYERCMFLVNLALKTGNFRRALTEVSALYHEAPEVPEIRDMYHKITALMPDQRKL